MYESFRHPRKIHPFPSVILGYRSHAPWIADVDDVDDGVADNGLGCTERLQTTFANDPNDVNDYLVVCKRNDRLGAPCRESNPRV